MASAYSTDLKLELMVTGENSGTWGDKTNTNLNLVQQAIAGYEAIDVASADVTLAMTNETLSNARNAVLNLTGTLAGTRVVNVPDGIEKTYIVADSTTRAGFTLTIKTVSGTGVAIPAGKTVLVYSDGTNVVDVFFMKDLVEDTTPQLGGDLDANGNNILIDSGNFIGDENGLEQVKFATTASAVNELTITNAATGNAPNISATGGDTNVNLQLTPKGSGVVVVDGNASSGGISISDGLIDIRTGTGNVAKVKFYCESANAHAQTLQAAPHSYGSSAVLILPLESGYLIGTGDTGTLPLAAINIDGGTDIGAALTTSDLIIVDDGAGGTNRKSTLARMITLVQANIDDPTALSIALG